MKGVYGRSRPKNPRMNALTCLPNHRSKQNAMGDPLWSTAATKWTNTSLTSKEMFFFFRYTIQTMVYLGTKLLGGSHESLDAAKSFQRTF